MTPKRKAALEWVKAGSQPASDEPSFKMLQDLTRDGLLEFRQQVTDYRTNPEGVTMPAGHYLTEEGEEALRQAQPAMSFQEAITADSIFRGYDLPKSSNHDKPERRVARMIAKGWLVEDGKSLTAKGALAVAAFGEREGWHPDGIEELRRLAEKIEAIRTGMST